MLKVGDRVRAKRSHGPISKGAIGTMLEDGTDGAPFVRWDGLTFGHDGGRHDGSHDCWSFLTEDLESAATLDEEIEEFVSGYEFYGEDAEGREGTYAPNEREQRLIVDAILGWENRS